MARKSASPDPRVTGKEPKKKPSKPRKQNAKSAEKKSAENIGKSRGGIANLIPFQKGVSGNPGGRPKSEKTVKALAREHTAEAIKTLADIMRDKEASMSARVTACLGLLDRGHGKPLQQLEVGEAGAFSDLEEEALDAFIAHAALQLKAGGVAGHA
jgi:hypothetical protein